VNAIADAGRCDVYWDGKRFLAHLPVSEGLDTWVWQYPSGQLYIRAKPGKAPDITYAEQNDFAWMIDHMTTTQPPQVPA
jgi:hypothetical protein